MKRLLLLLLISCTTIFSVGVFAGNTCGNATPISVSTGDDCTPQVFAAWDYGPSNFAGSCVSISLKDFYFEFEAINTVATIKFGNNLFPTGQMVVYEECEGEIYCTNSVLSYSEHELSGLTIGVSYQIRILFPAGVPPEGSICVYSPDCTPQNWYADNDNDGYGNEGSIIIDCFQPTGYVSNDLDCDDNDPDIHPDATEICNDIDDNCNGLIDNEDPDVVGQELWYADLDGDGYGDTNSTLLSCDQPEGYVDVSYDCDDLNFYVNPEMEEICNGYDDNCDGLIDDDDPYVLDQQEWYADLDGDGYGDMNDFVFSCDQPDDYVDNFDDCDDAEATVFPNAPELNDDLDNDCDGEIDEDYDLAVEIQIMGQTLFAQVTGTHPPFTYLWSTGETTESIDILAGDIWVEVTDNLGYISIDEINIAGVQNPDKHFIRCYPNPSSDIITIEFNEGTNEEVFFDIFDMNGKIKNLKAAHIGDNKWRIELLNKALKQGIFYIRIKSQNRTTHLPVLYLKK